MPVVANAYSVTEDLLVGDIVLPARHGDGSAIILSTAEEIDAQIGHIYITPIVVNPDPKYRPSALILKKINNFLASGRLLMDMAAAEEDHETQAYARYLMREATNLLAQIANGQIVLAGVARNTDDDIKQTDKVAIYNEDSYSLVEGFYRRVSGDELIYDMVPYSGDSQDFN